MTFRAFMAENGYNVQTTFWEDFSAADIFGLSAIQDTFNRAFEEWKGNCTRYGSTIKRNRMWRRCMMHSGDRQTSMRLRI